MNRSEAFVLVACNGFLGACGSAARDDYRLPDVPDANAAPLLTIDAHITEVSVEVPSTTRAALVWFPVSAGAAKIQMSQDLGLPQMKEVLDLRIDIADVPPEGVLAAGSGQAELVFYLDTDGNNRLDVYPLGMVSPDRDRVIGRAPDSRVVWAADGAIGAFNAPAKTLPTGPRVCIKEAPDFARQCDPRSDQPSAPPMPIPVRFSDEEVLKSYTCSGFLGSQEWPDDSPWLSPNLRKQICNGCSASPSGGEGGCAYQTTQDGGWKACISDVALCGTTFCHVGKGPLVPGQSDCK